MRDQRSVIADRTAGRGFAHLTFCKNGARTEASVPASLFLHHFCKKPFNSRSLFYTHYTKGQCADISDFHAGVCRFQCVRVDHQHGAVQFSCTRNSLIGIIPARRCRIVDRQHHVRLPDDCSVGFQLCVWLFMRVNGCHVGAF